MADEDKRASAPSADNPPSTTTQAAAPPKLADNASPDDVASYADALFSSEAPPAEAGGQSQEGPEGENQADRPPADPPADKQDQPADAQAEPKFKVKIDGVETEVTADELRRGYQRQQDYSRKTAEVANERRAIQSERKRLGDAAAFYLQQAQLLDPILAKDDKYFAELAQKDPAQWVIEKQEHATRVRAFQQAQADAQFAQEQEEIDRINREHRALEEKLPEWKDPDKRKVIAKEVDDYLASNGFEIDERAALKDHRAIIIIRKAAAYDKWTKAQSEAQKKRVATPPAKAAAPQATGQQNASQSAKAAALKKQADRTGDPRDIAEWADAILTQ